MKKVLRIPARVVFYRESDRWIAHCLELDLIGDGETRDEAMECLWEAIGIQIEESLAADNPANLFSPAEGKYFEMFAAGKDIAVGEVTIQLHFDSVVVERPQTREYSDDLVTA